MAGFGGLWRALSGFIGFYRVLSGFILPLFIEPPQLAATAALLLFPAMATFRYYKQASTINSVFQPREPSSIVEGSLVPADVARKEGDVARNPAGNRTVHGATGRVARNVTLLVLVALRLVRASKTTVLAAFEGRSSNTTPLSSSTATPPFPRLWSHFIDTGRNKERAMGRCAHATGL